MRERLRERTNGYTVTAGQYVVLARVALVALTLIVLTGAAVRLTGSGLGCPTWPKCYGNYYPPLNTHSVIEFSNRVVSVPVVLAAGLAWVGALRRRPYRRDLVWLAALLPLGVIGQAVLGGLHGQGRSRLRLGDGPLRAVDADPAGGRRARVAEPGSSLLRMRTEKGASSRTRAGACMRCPRPRSAARAARAGRARRADDLRRHRCDRRRPARGRLAGPADQPAVLRRHRHDGLRDPPPRRDRPRLRRWRRRRLVPRPPPAGAGAGADGR